MYFCISCKQVLVGKARKFCSSKCKNDHHNQTVRGTDFWRKRRKSIKIKAIEYKGGQCFCCGYSKCTRALNFHHLDPSEKDFTVSQNGIKMAFDKLKLELDKCILVCSNCHMEIHEGILEIGKGLEPL